jgi:hypothetical protein
MLVFLFCDVEDITFLNGDNFLISPKKKRLDTLKINITNPPFLLGTAFKMLYWHKKYHSGTICKGVRKAHASNALSG